MFSKEKNHKCLRNIFLKIISIPRYQGNANTSRFYLTPVGIIKVKKTTNDDVDVGKGKHSLLAEV